jgi:outer membrane receptor protein involved in Fe transport
LSINDPGGFCAQIGRNTFTGERDTVQGPYVNQGTIETSGVDFQVNWISDMAGGGSIYVNSLVSVLSEYKLQDSPTEPFLDAKGTLAEGGQYDYRLNTTLGYNFAGGKASLGMLWIHLPEVEDAALMRTPNSTVLPVDSYNRFNLFAGYNFSDRLALRGGIDNVFEADPPIVGANPASNSANAASTNTQYYDVLGRRAYVALKMSF